MIVRLCKVLLFVLATGVYGAGDGESPRRLKDSPQLLVNSGELRVRIDVETDAPLYQRSPVIFAVEVATPRWFSRGTRVRDFRVPGAIVLPVSNFASNQTRVEDGESWTVQRWRFRLFAFAPGLIQLPELRVFVSVNRDGGQISQGEITLTHPPLDIVAPPGTEGLANWLATTAMTVQESWDGQRESYQVGDAITRRRRIAVTDAPGMMIPSVATEPVAGLSLYQSPAAVRDIAERGSLSGRREETLVITIEEPGDYSLPASSYRWFDTVSGQLRTEQLPTFTFSAATAATVKTAEGRQTPDLRRLGMAAIALLVIAAALWAARRLPWQRFLGPLRKLRRRRLRRRHFLHSVHSGDASAALDALYQRVATTEATPDLSGSVSHNSEARRVLRQLLHCAYGSPEQNCAELTAAEASTLWIAIDAEQGLHTPREVLALNPRSPQRQQAS